MTKGANRKRRVKTSRRTKIELDLDPIWRNGKLLHQVFVRRGNEMLHVDAFDISDAKQRTRFCQELDHKVNAQGKVIDLTKFEQVLMRHAHALSQDLHEPDRKQSTDPKEVLDAFGIEVLGEKEDQSIICWSKNTRKRWVVKSPAKWAVHEMLQAVGPVANELLWYGAPPPPEGKYSADELRQAVALEAARASRISDRKLIGQGIWKRGHLLLIVNGSQAHVFYENKNIRRVSHPQFKGEIIDFNESKSWTDLKSVLTNYKAMTKLKAQKVMGRLEELLTQWNWTHRWDHRIVSRLILATFIQTCWTWRPLVSIIGPSDSGKSTLLTDILFPLLGEWTVFADRSSEAGLRQAIGNSAAPVVIDEFDQYRQRQQVLELFRTSSRGGKILRGTANQDRLEFGVRHIPWLAAIESGDRWGQDRNRFIRFELQPPENRGNLSLPSTEELQEMRQSLIAIALWAAPSAIRLADSIKSTQIEGVHGRLVESFSVPAAMDAVVRHGEEATAENAVKSLRAFLRGRASLDEQGEPDEVQLFRDILNSMIQIRYREKERMETRARTIGQVICGWNPVVPHCERELIPDIEAVGIKIIEPCDASSELFLVPDVIREKLLRGTRWEQTRMDQVLKRLPGAERTQQRCARQRPHGISLPWPGCLNLIDGEDGE